MKLYTIALCVCFVQMSSWLNTADGYLVDEIYRNESNIAEIVRQWNSKATKTPDVIEVLRENSHGDFQLLMYNSTYMIKEASPQFIKDLNIIVKTFENNTYVEVILSYLLTIFEFMLRGKEKKIRVTDIMNFRGDGSIDKDIQEQHSIKIIERADVLQTILSAQLPPERFDGIISLWLVTRLNVPEKEIEDALTYLYGTEDQKPQFNNTAVINSYNCKLAESQKLAENRMHAELQEFSKNNTKINPKVFEDMSTVAEKIPCNTIITGTLQRMIYQLEDLAKVNLTKIDAYGFALELTNRRVALDLYSVLNLLSFDNVLSTRLPDQDFTNLKKLTQFVYTKMSINEIGNVLEYVYGPEQYKMEAICGKDS